MCTYSLVLLGEKEVGSASKEKFTRIASPLVAYPSKKMIRAKSETVAKYTQWELWEPGFRPDEELNEKRPMEALPISWIRTIAEDKYPDHKYEYQLTCNEAIPPFQELNDWPQLSDMRGDGCFVYKDAPRGTKGLPALWTETESKGDDLYSCINKAARGVITQLRCLRTYSDEIVQCNGFVFPADKPSVVSVISVEWKRLAMLVDVQCLERRIVHEKVVEALGIVEENRQKLLRSTGPKNFFIRLSPEDINLIDDEMVADSFQIESKHSIVVAAPPLLYKLPSNYEEVVTLHAMLFKRSTAANVDSESDVTVLWCRHVCVWVKGYRVRV